MSESDYRIWSNADLDYEEWKCKPPTEGQVHEFAERFAMMQQNIRLSRIYIIAVKTK